MGVSLGSCTPPAVGKPGFVLGETEIEVGLGIHGEQGVQRMPIASADALVKLVIETIEADGKLAGGDRVALLVNGLGATPPMELAIVGTVGGRAAGGERCRRGTRLGRHLPSALDMPGFSLSVLQVDDAALDLVDAPADAGAWPRGGAVNRARVQHSANAAKTLNATNKKTAAGMAGAEAAASMKPRLGRASYLGEWVVGHPDRGGRGRRRYLARSY